MAYGRGRKKPRSVSSDGDVGVGGGGHKDSSPYFLMEKWRSKNKFVNGYGEEGWREVFQKKIIWKGRWGVGEGGSKNA